MRIDRVLRYQRIKLARLFGSKPSRWGLSLVGLVLIVGLLWRLIPLDSETDYVSFGELPDFSAYSNVNQMKASFFEYLEPIIDYHNQLIATQRARLNEIVQLVSDKQLRDRDKEFLTQIALEYDYEMLEGWDTKMGDNRATHPINRSLRQLLLRVDEIPPDLALVQAAKESGWGRSRFATQANNLFGQWCYSEGCGLVPEQRIDGANHEVRKFDSVADAIGSYMNNLNSFHSYETFRLIRGGLRAAEDSISGMILADGLIYYSQRREAYVDEIKTMIRQYHQFRDEYYPDLLLDQSDQPPTPQTEG